MMWKYISIISLGYITLVASLTFIFYMVLNNLKLIRNNLGDINYDRLIWK